MSIETTTPVNRIVVRNLIKRFHHQPILNQLSLTIHDGDCCLLVGDNGAGKTTLLRILAGLVRPNHGEVILCGSSAANAPQLRRKIGYVGHHPMFYQELTPLENLCHYTQLYQVEDPQTVVTQALLAAGLSHFQHQPVRTLSRGMQQRLALVRATLHNPTILLFDEPYTGLDQQAANTLDITLQGLHKPGHTILLAAHRPQRLLRIASHIAWLRDGTIFQHIPVDGLDEAPELQHYLQEVA